MACRLELRRVMPDGLRSYVCFHASSMLATPFQMAMVCREDSRRSSFTYCMARGILRWKRWSIAAKASAKHSVSGLSEARAKYRDFLLAARAFSFRPKRHTAQEKCCGMVIRGARPAT